MLSRMPNRLVLAHTPTPLRKLSTLSSRFPDTNIWLKADDTSGFALSGNKVRKLEFLLADAKEKGCDYIITCGGMQSNHCRATAFACAQLGLKCHLILRNDLHANKTSTAGQANHFLDGLCGAKTSILSVSSYQSKLDTYVEQAVFDAKCHGFSPYSIPVGGSNALGVWGYVAAMQEIQQQSKQLGFMPDLIVCASGSGGTQAGLNLGVTLLSMPTSILGFAVCDSEAYFLQKIKQDIEACCIHAGLKATQKESIMKSISLNVNDNYIGSGYALADQPIYNTIKDLARTEGILLDPVYTAKAMHGLLSELSKGSLTSTKNIIFVHTGGGFGIFPHASEINT